MALLSLIFNKPKKVRINAPEGSLSNEERELIVLDATTQINHNLESSVTDNPIEDGSLISDHVDVKPKRLTITAIMSEAPISLESAIIGNVAGVAGGVVGGFQGNIATFGIAALGGQLLNKLGDRVKEAFKAISEIREKKIAVTIQTGLDTYNNMIITSFLPIETASNGDSLSFTASFKEIKVANFEKVIVRSLNIDTSARDSGSEKQNLGKQGADEPNASLAFKGLQKINDVSSQLFGGQ